jgi:hypothetical protein
MFYDKQSMPSHRRASIATTMCHNERDINILIVYENEIRNYIPNVHPMFAKLIPEHKADYFRVNVLGMLRCVCATKYLCCWYNLVQFGGMYVDTDTIGLGPLIHLFQHLHTFDIVNIDYRRHRLPIQIGILGPWRSNTTIARRCKEEQDKLLDTKFKMVQTHTHTHTHTQTHYI